MLGEAQLYVHAESTALVMLLTPTSKVREWAVNVAGEAWLARTWASANVRRYIEASYSGKGIPPLHASRAPSCRPMASQYRASELHNLDRMRCQNVHPRILSLRNMPRSEPANILSM